MPAHCLYIRVGLRGEKLLDKGASCQRCLLSDRHKHRFNNSLRRSRSFVNNSLWLRVRRNLFSLFHSLVSFSFSFVEIMSIFSGLYCAAFQPQSSGVTESFFTENVELTNLRNQVSDLQLSRDSLQEDVKTKDEKIGKLVSATLRSKLSILLASTFLIVSFNGKYLYPCVKYNFCVSLSD